MTQFGSAEHEVQAWLDTIDATGPQTLRTLSTLRTPAPTTIVPRSRDQSARRAEEFLAELARRGHPIELRVGKVLGEGGMGLVREAEQVALGRVVAVKTLKPGPLAPGAASDLLREAWITGALEHPNVVPVHHLEIADDLSPLLILKRIDGVEWRELAGDAAEVQRRFGATDLLAWNLGILGQVLNALRFAHARGVIHRDLKPSNVMIGNFGEVYLLDWGIALSLHDDPRGRFPLAREATELAGTPSYMAPEMLLREGSPPLSERTDVYLAGAVLFELLTGHPPHLGANAIAVLTSVVLSRPMLPPEIPAEIAQICLRAMQPDPAQRFASIEELQLALAGYLEHRGSARLTRGATARLAELVTLAATHAPAEREELYRQLAICRFAFHEALAVWRDNAEARAGLARASLAVAEFELACGDPRAAVTLLSELDERPALLAQAEAAVARQAARHHELEQLGRDSDPTVHIKTRRTIVGLGFALSVLPLVNLFVPEFGELTSPEQVLWASLVCAFMLVIGVFVRGRKMTAINRRLFATATFLFGAQAVISTGGWILGVDPAHMQVMNIFLWGVVCGMFALTVDPWLGVTSLMFFAGFLLAARFPAHRLIIMGCCNAVFTLLVALRWRTTAEKFAAADTSTRLPIAGRRGTLDP